LNDWIPVTERYPDPGQTVWFYVRELHEVDCGLYEQMETNTGELIRLWGGWMAGDKEGMVTHWKPLEEWPPAPPA
jgi:hypothetical protein